MEDGELQDKVFEDGEEKGYGVEKVRRMGVGRRLKTMRRVAMAVTATMRRNNSGGGNVSNGKEGRSFRGLQSGG